MIQPTALTAQSAAIETPEIRSFVFAHLRNMVKTAQEHRGESLQSHRALGEVV